MLGYDKIDSVRKWHDEKKVLDAVEALKKRNFQAVFLHTKEECLEYLEKTIPDDSIVSCGGSVTLHEIGIIDRLEKRGNKVIHSFKKGLSKDEQFEVMKQGMLSDVFLTSCNALTEDGRLYFVDGVGNRISSVIFGPKKTIIIVGVNKIVSSFELAIERVKRIAAPMNIRRYYKEGRSLPPCAVAGRCCDCKSPLKICNIKMVLEGKPSAIDCEVIVVNNTLGF